MVGKLPDLQHVEAMAKSLGPILSNDKCRSELFQRIALGTKDKEQKRSQFCSTVGRKLTRRSPPLLARLSAGSPSITLRNTGCGADE